MLPITRCTPLSVLDRAYVIVNFDSFLALSDDLRSLSATGRHATVWKAVDTLTGEVVAIKVLHTSLDDMTRVRYEVSIIADLKSVFSEENM